VASDHQSLPQAADDSDESPWKKLATRRDLFEELAADESQPLSDVAQQIIDELDRREIDVSQ